MTIRICKTKTKRNIMKVKAKMSNFQKRNGYMIIILIAVVINNIPMEKKKKHLSTKQNSQK